MKKMIVSWMRYAVGEGLTKATNSTFAKFIGSLSGSLGFIVFVTFAVSVIQMLGGLVGNLSYRKDNLFPGIKAILGSALFGTIAFAMTVIGIFRFTYEDADLGIATFIVLFSIFPGTLFDWLFFKNNFNIRQWFGAGIFLLSGYAVLNFPAFETLLSLPPWVWLSAIIALLLAVNELITRLISSSLKTNPLVYNFWVGLFTVFIAIIYLTIMNQWHSVAELSPKIFFISVIMGIVIFVMISFKFLSYKVGGTIASKKIIMQGTYLITAMIAGLIFFNEPFTLGKVIGILGFFTAFSLINNEVWQVVKIKLLKSN
jgi:drug/metabolite transporter (DMT)-like permease|tara:strand:- start:2556 stop:3497 length:942 start_codon:yes stop_codon:yes gene_type:complete